MNDPRFRFGLVPTLLALACLAPGAEVGWQGAPGDKPPTGWNLAATSAEATVHWLDGELVVQATPTGKALATCDLAVADATDEKPLRVSALVSASGVRPLAGYPALVGLEWASGACFAVGLGDDPHDRNEQRRGWAVWSSAGKAGAAHIESTVFAGASPTHLRLVVTARDVAAYVSSDGWSWQRIAGVDRALWAAQGPPRRLVLGRGRVGEQPGFAADPPGDAKAKPCTYRFAALRVEQDTADLSASLIRTYAKQDTLEDTRQAIAAAGRISAWRLQGPLPWPRDGLPAELPVDLLAQGAWKEHATEETVLQLSRLLPGGSGDNQLYWAVATVQTTEDGPLRLLFDAMREVRIYVDGRLVAIGDAERSEAEPDRQVASVSVRAGAHVIAMAVRSRQGAAAILRTENGDPRWQIALLKRLAVDFPDDAELAQTAPMEISRLWEGLGFARAAAEALADLAKRGDGGDGGEAGERASSERARLLNNLRDEAAVAAEITELGRRWAEGADRLGAFVRTSQLWMRLDAPERALGALEEALKLPDLPTATRVQLGVERARLRLRQNDEVACAVELRTAAKALPDRDPGRFDLLAAALARDVAQGKGVAQPLVELSTLATTALQFRRIAGLYGLAKDEAGRVAARRAAAERTVDGLDLPGVDVAEAIAGTDAAGAAALYRQTLQRLGLAAPAEAQLPQLRAALIRGTIVERIAGRELLAAGAAAGQEQLAEMTWKVAGPVASPNWRAYTKNLVDPANVDTSKPVEGKVPWREVPADCLNNGIIDLGRMGNNAGACVYYLTAEFDSASERTAVLTCGADDSLTLWLNGKRLYQDRLQRAVEPNAIVIPGRLLKGRNRILAMVYNGAGGSGFQCSLRSDGWLSSDIMAALRHLETEDGRPRALTVLHGIWWGLQRANRLSEAAALLRAIVRAWPDNIDLQSRLCRQVLDDDGRWRSEPGLMAEVVTWFDALIADRRCDDTDLRGTIQEPSYGRLLNAGEFELALGRLRRDNLVELDPTIYARNLGREADLWMRAGYPRLAAATYTRARVQAFGDAALDRDLERRTRAVRKFRGDLVLPNTSIDVLQLMRGAEASIEAGEFERAAGDYQKLIEGGRDQPAAVAGGQLRGVAAWAAGRLYGSSKALAAWRERWEPRIRDQLARSLIDPVALERLVERFPVGTSSVAALVRLSELYAARGWWELCSGTCRRVLSEWGEGVPDRDRLQARLDLARARTEQTQVDPNPKMAVVNMAFEAVRGGSVLQPNWSAASTDAGIVLSGPGEIVMVDPAQGRLRWRSAGDGPWPAVIGINSQAIPASGVAVGGGAVVARVQHGGLALEAYALGDGHLRWSSSDLAELAGLTAISQPTVANGRVYGLFADRSRCLMVAMDLASGGLLWTTTISAGLTRQPLSGGGDLFLAGHAAAPRLAGRELFVCTDAGLVAALDACSGSILWLHAYARTATSVQEEGTLRHLQSRQAGVIVADEKRIFIHPRDTLAMIALDRATGLVAWTNEISHARVFAGLGGTGADRRLILQGAEVRCLDAASGVQRWRWHPGLDDGEVAGQPAIGGEAVWVATTTGLMRLALADGSARRMQTWKQLGVDGVPANLAIHGDALVACGDGVAVVLQPEGTPVVIEVPRQSVAGPLPATGAKPTKDGVPVPAWILPGGVVSGILRPDEGSDGEAYAVVGDRLVRVNASTGDLLWSVPCPPVTELKAAGNLVMAISGPSAVAYDRATGARRWNALLEASFTRRLIEPGNMPSTHLGADGLLSWRVNEGWWSLRSATDGRILCSGNSGSRVVGGLTRAGKIHLAVIQPGGQTLVIEIRDARSGVIEDTIPTGVSGPPTPYGAAGLMPDGSLVIPGTTGSVRWFPEPRQAQVLTIDFRRVITSTLDGDCLSIVGQLAQGGIQGVVIDKANGKLISREKIHDGSFDWRAYQPWIPRNVGGNLTRAMVGREGKTGILVRAPGGKEIAFAAVATQGWRHWLGMADLGDQALWLAWNAGGRHHAYLLGADGSQVAEAAIPAIPGTAGVSPPPPVVVGGLVLYGSSRGLCGLIPRGTAPLVDPGATPAARETAGLAVGVRASALVLPFLTQEPWVDAEASDWGKAVVPIEITAAQGWREFDAGAVPAAQSLRIRAACSEGGLHLLIQAPLATTEFRLAADLHHDDREAYPEALTMLRLTVADGRPQMRVSGLSRARLLDLGSGAVADGRPQVRVSGLQGQDETPAPQPVWRLALGVSAITAEVTLPWRCLTSWKDFSIDRQAPRLGLRLGALVILTDAMGRRGGLEWGHGLSRGLFPGNLVRAGVESAAKK